MNIVILSSIDYAGSGLRIRDALRLAQPGINVRAFVHRQGAGNVKWGIPTGRLMSRVGLKEICRVIMASDIIHYKGDWAYDGVFHGIKMPKRKIVYTFCGSFFRRREGKYPRALAIEKYPLSAYKGDLLTAFTPELLYLPKMVLTPFPWNTFKYRFKKGSKFVIAHIPSTSAKKGTDIILAGINLLKRNDITVKHITNMKYKDSLEAKANSHIYIDQFMLPVYGNSAVEAMSYGIPTMNWDEGLYPYPTPIIKAKNRTPESIAEALNYWCDWNKLQQLSEQTFEYCKEVHGGVGKQFIKLYSNVLQNKI